MPPIPEPPGPRLRWRARLVHADSGARVVAVELRRGEELLGTALGEASSAEAAEDRAIARLLERLQDLHLQDPHPQAAQQRPQQAQAAASAAAPAPAVAAAPAAMGRTGGANPLPRTTPPDPAAATAATAAAAEPQLPSEPMVDNRPEHGSEQGHRSRSEPRPEPSAAQATPEADAEPVPDPEDWSSELAQIELQLARLGWQRPEEGTYLERAFGHPSRSRLTSYGDLVAYLQALSALEPGSDPTSAAVPLRRRDLLAQCDQLLAQLGWDAAQGRRFLEQQFGVASRQQLNDSQLLQFNMLLEESWLASTGQTC